MYKRQVQNRQDNKAAFICIDHCSALNMDVGLGKRLYGQIKYKLAFQSKTDHPKTHFCTCDLDLMTLICELELKILKMYPHTKNKLSGSRLLKVRALWTDTRMRPNVSTINTADFWGGNQMPIEACLQSKAKHLRA